MSGGKASKKPSKESARYHEIKGEEHKEDCRARKSKRDESVIGRKPGQDTEEEIASIGSTLDRAQQRAIKIEARNRIWFRCPNCKSSLKMMVTKRKKWDDDDSLSDAKEEWSSCEAE